MAEFGWAYVSGALGKGGTHAVQTSDSASNLSGSQSFVYDGSSVVLTGSLLIKGDMDLSGTLNIDTLNVNETIILAVHKLNKYRREIKYYFKDTELNFI